MEESGVFPEEAADVAMQAIKDGVARVQMTREQAFAKAKADIDYSRNLIKSLTDNGFIQPPEHEMLQNALNWAVKQVL